MANKSEARLFGDPRLDGTGIYDGDHDTSGHKSIEEDGQHQRTRIIPLFPASGNPDPPGHSQRSCRVFT